MTLLSTGGGAPAKWSAARTVVRQARTVLGQEWIDAKVRQLEQDVHQLEQDHQEANENPRRLERFHHCFFDCHGRIRHERDLEKHDRINILERRQ